MALADTARLIASLELQDKFSATAGRFDRTLGRLESGTNTLGRIGTRVGQGLGAAANNLKTIGVVAAGVIAANVAAGVASLNRLEQVEAQTEAVLASTKNAAGVTAAQVRALAEEFENLNATIDDKVIQSAENLLLTFTNVRGAAFEPALQAILDMNQAMGGGEEGLQGVVIQVGKALQDPIRGITALRRVGVAFTEDQQKQIKALVEENRLFEAQQLILAELATEFGGSFARAGDTAAGKFAKVQDAVEDAQQALATAFLPVLGRVADKVESFLSDPATLRRIEEFGTGLAEGFDDLLATAQDLAGKVPWETIGDSLQIAGAGAKAVLDSFLALPAWIQTAVLTGWGLNKLTGGALGGIVGELAKGLIRGVLGINAAVVNINAATVNGGIPGVGPPGRSGAGNLLVGGVGLASIVAAATGGLLALDQLQTAIREGSQQGITEGFLTFTGGPGALISEALTPIVDPLVDAVLGTGDKIEGAIDKNEEERHQQQEQQDSAAAARFQRDQIAQREIQSYQRRTADVVAQQLSSSRSALTYLQRIDAKDFSPTVNVQVTSNVTISEIQRKITSQQIAVGNGPLEGPD